MVIIRTLLKNEMPHGLPPADIFVRVNDMIAARNESSTFATIFCAVLDLRAGAMEHAYAGHNPPLLREPGGRFAFLQPVRNPVLGPLSGMTFKPGKLKLAHGMTMLLYTDGRNEAMDAGGNQFGNDRLVAEANAKPAADEAGLSRGIRAAVATHAAGTTQSDNITMLALRFR